MNQTNSAFKQVSLPIAFLDEVKAAADAADRSVPKQIEHWVRLAQALEQVLPPKTVNDAKQGTLPKPDLLTALAAVLANPKVEADGWRISVDPNDPTRVWQTSPNGAVFHGTLLEDGGFVPNP